MTGVHLLAGLATSEREIEAVKPNFYIEGKITQMEADKGEERTRGQFLLKSIEKERHRCLISNSRSRSRALSAADCATAVSRRETE